MELIDGVSQEAQGCVLDVGCGPGAYAQQLQQRGFNVYGIDVSGQLLQVCKSRLGLPDPVFHRHFKEAKVEQIPFESATFDILVCIGVIGYVTSEEVALREMLRVLRPGGYLILGVENVLSFSNIDYVLLQLASRAKRGVGKTRSDVLKTLGFPSPWERRQSGMVYRLHNPWNLEKLVAAVGFQRIRAMTLGHEMRLARRSGIIPERWLSACEVWLERRFRNNPVKYLAYSGEFYLGMFRKERLQRAE